MKNTKSHTEKIECPKCLTRNIATVLHTYPFRQYVHHCNSCGYVIMESEWKIVTQEERIDFKEWIIKTHNGIAFSSKDNGIVIFEDQNEIALKTYPILEMDHRCDIPNGYNVEIFPEDKDWRAGETYQLFARLIKK